MQTLNLSNCFQDDTMLRRVFSWLTRIGAAPKFGSRPIGWYQIHQCHCIDILREYKAGVVRCRNGVIEMRNYGQSTSRAKWIQILTPDGLYRQADNRSRQ